MDSHGRVLDANQEYVRLSGHTSLHDILGKNVVEWTAERSKQPNAEAVAECLKNGFIKDFVTEYVDRNGKITPVEINGSVEGSRILSLCRDITERKLAEEALRENETRFRAFIEQSPVSIGVFDLQGFGLYANHKCIDTLGLQNVDEFIGRAASDFFSPEFREDSKERTRRRLAGLAVPPEYEAIALRSDGTAFPVHLAVAPILLSGRTLSIAFITDITERKHTEARVRESEARYRQLFNGSPDGVVLIGPDGCIAHANIAQANIFRYDSPEELIGIPATQLIAPSYRATGAQIMQRRLNGEDVPPVEHELLRRDGTTFYGTTSAAILRDAEGKVTGYICTTRDTSERKKTQEALVMAKEAAEKANRVKSEFLANMSHELRTPMNPILGFTEMLSEAPNLTDEQRTWLGMVNKRGNDLLKLIEAILDVSKIEAEKVVIERMPFALRMTMQDMVGSVLPIAAKKSLRLEWDVSQEMPEEYLADGLRLRQIILNLLNNAIKFTPTGSITVHVQDGRASQLGRSPEKNEAALLFSIQDTGIGIPVERQTAIFEAFTHADTAHAVNYGGGAGLGLTIANRLVELMDGKMWVQTQTGKGSTFFFTVIVGVKQPAAELIDPVQSVSSVGQLNALKILIVDDDQTSVMLAKALLNRAGHKAQTVQDGQQALTLMEKEVFDVVLMDIQMPVMDGIEATQAIRKSERKSGRHTVIVAMTAFAMHGDRERFLGAGMDGYLSKPMKVAELMAVLKR